MKSICFIVNKYPNSIEPYMLIFLQQLAWSIADMDIQVSVICPLAINIIPKYILFPYHKKEITDNGKEIDIFFPKTIGFGQSHIILGKSPVSLTTFFLEKAAEKTLVNMEIKPDVLYGHFLAPSGITVARLGRKYKIPNFFAYGETHDTIGQFGLDNAKKELSNINGVIAVSSFLRDQIVEKGIVPIEKTGVFPNAIRSDRFYQRNKKEARRKFNLPENEILAAFVGGYSNRKGILRVCEAINKVEGVKLICAGAGKFKPYGNNLLFSRELNPDEIPWFNSAADFFVLPTLLEGCSNAIVEAMACGLPIISSNMAFNDDILDDSCSIRVNPYSIDEIEHAIRTLVENEKLRQNMSKNAIKKASILTLERRAMNIVSFIEEHL